MITLTNKQQQVIDLVHKRENVMISGPGGTGKSYLIKHILSIKDSILFDKSKTIGVTAMTGAAAVLIGGTTLHSFLGIGLGKDSVLQMIDKIQKTKKINFWKSLQILIIDEVSMLSVELFDKLEVIAREVRQNKNPFGGIQLILSGDFLQLPCIKGDFCFKSTQWKKCISNVICFDEILRQTDPTFHEILNRARFGKTTNTDIEVITSNSEKNFSDQNDESFIIKPTMLLCKRIDTDMINKKELDKLKNTQLYTYNKIVIWEDNEDQKVLSALNYIPDCVSLRIGAQVMLTVNKNVEEQLVNGSRGIVVEFSQYFSRILPVVQFMDKKITIDMYNYTIENGQNKPVVTVSQIPLQLAYALTIHKCMGSTLDCVYIDFDGVFEYGQAYVALSRVKSLKNLCVKNIYVSSFKAHPEALCFYEKIQSCK